MFNRFFATLLTVFALAFAGQAWAACPTLNPSDKSSLVTLSNGNLTAAHTAGVGAWDGVRATASITGKTYVEVTVVASATNIQAGFANASQVLTDYWGNSVNAFGWVASGIVYLNGGAAGTINTYTTGNKLRLAFDPTAKLFWGAVDGGNWNNSGTANPATGVGGLNMAALAAGPYLPGLSFSDNSTSMTVNYGASAFTYATPAGFSKPAGCPAGGLFFMGPF